MTTEYTHNFRLNLPDFRMGPWHDLVNTNTVKIDDLLLNIAQGVDTPVWQNNTEYEAGQTTIDVIDASYWMCSVSHTSSPVPTTFPQDRAAHPTWWTRVVVGIAPRGEWLNSTPYGVNDMVTSTAEGTIALCKQAHTSSPVPATIRTDAVYWSFIADIGDVTAEEVTYTTPLWPDDWAYISNVKEALDAGFAYSDQLFAISNDHEVRLDAVEDVANAKVSRIGDTMTGPLILPVITPLGGEAVRWDYIDANKQNKSPTLTALSTLNSTGTGVVEQTGVDAFNKRKVGVASSTDLLSRAHGDGRYALVTHNHDGSYVESAGDAMTGNLSLPVNANSANNSLNWGTPGTGINGGVNAIGFSTGGVLRATIDLATFTMAVPVVLSADPTAAMQATTKQYVDTKAPLDSPVFVNNPRAPTPAPGDNDDTIATTAFVTNAVNVSGGTTPSNATPIMDGVAAPGTALQFARGDHVHPTDTSRASLTYVNTQDALKVTKTGDTMTGDLKIDKANARLTLNQALHATEFSSIRYTKVNNLRWELSGAWGTESGGDTGSDFSIDRFNDVGAYIDSPIEIIRSTGVVNFSANTNSRGAFTSQQSATTGSFYFGASGTKYLTYDSTDFRFSGGSVYAPVLAADSSIWSGTAGATGSYFFGNTGTKYLSYDGTNFVFSGGQLVVNNGINADQIYANTNLIAHGNVYSGFANATYGIYYFGNNATKYLQYDGTNFNIVGGTLINGNGFSGSAYVAGDASFGPTAIELGWYASAAPVYIDFHSGGVGGDYDVRIISTGGTGIGNGNLGITCGTAVINCSSTSFLGILKANGAAHAWPLCVNAANDFQIGFFSDASFGRIGCLNNTGGAWRPLAISCSSLNIDSGLFVSGDCSVGGNIASGTGAFYRSATSSPMILTAGGALQGAYGYQCRNGVSIGGYGGNMFNMLWTSAMNLFVDNTLLGPIYTTCDYRIKKDVIDLDSTWDAVKSLRPIKYKYTDFSPPSHVKHVAQQKALAKEELENLAKDAEPSIIVPPDHLFQEDGIERWGFIAHELQETLTPSAAHGVKDDPDQIQSPDAFAVIAALTKALQEAMLRIEALEGGTPSVTKSNPKTVRTGRHPKGR